MNLDEVMIYSCRRKRRTMFNRVVVSIILSILFSVLLTAYSQQTTNNDEAISNIQSVYNVTTRIMDDVKDSTLTIKLKCRFRTIDIRSCNLYDPQYQTTYHKPKCVKTPCDKSILVESDHFESDNSYVGRFEIKERSSSVERLTVSSETSLKQLSFYRIVASHLLPGVDVSGKPEGTYSLIEESVYGNCEALVKIVRSQIKKDGPDDKRMVKIVPNAHYNGNKTSGNSTIVHEMLSIKRTRNLETCYPVQGLMIFNDFFYHPTMTHVHYDIKSSISRLIVSDRAFTSYTTEDVAMKNTEKGGNTTMMHIRTTVTLHSIENVEDKIPRISNPVSVELPFVKDLKRGSRKQ